MILGILTPIPVAARSKVWVCGLSLVGSWVRIPLGTWMSVVCCHEDVFVSGLSLVQRSPTECRVCK